MHDDEKAVMITHFINPYQFWYYSPDDDAYESVRDIEEELTKHFKNNYGPLVCDAAIRVGSEIAVRYIPRNKFIRARVEEVLKSQQNTIDYIVWAVDHGFPFKTKAQYCRPLPRQFNKKIDRVRCGGIEKVVPAALEYDFLQQKQTIVLKDKWCRRACDSLYQIISDATSIQFIENFKKDDQYWGDLMVYNYKGSVQHVSDCLINQEVAVRSIEKFKTNFLIPKRYLMSTWQTNDKNNNFKENTTVHPHSINSSNDERNCDMNDSDFENAQIKVAAWNDFNKKAMKKISATLVDVENTESASSLYDDLDDSASVPPVPTLDDFNIAAKTTTMPILKDDSFSNITKKSSDNRSQYLRQMRLKMHLRNKTESEKHASIEKLTESTTPNEIRSHEDGSLSFPNKYSLPSRNASDIASNAASNISCSTTTSRASYLNQLRLRTGTIRERKTDEMLSEVEPGTSKTTALPSLIPKNNLLLPAGFDLANLNKYNRADHWHCKKTTRNDYHPHHEEDFRFTRANTDKHKNIENKIESNESENIQLTKNNTNHKTPESVIPVMETQSTTIKSEENENCSISDIDDYVNGSDDDNVIDDGIEDDDENSSSASSRISMYTAKSSLDFEFESPNSLNSKNETKPPQKSTTTATTNLVNDSLQNFIKRTPKNVVETKVSTAPLPQLAISQTLTMMQRDSNASSQSLRCPTGNRELRVNYSHHTVLAHATIDVKPIESLNKIPLAPDVRDAMVSRGFNRVSRTQAYAWPHMLQGNSLFVVNPPDSCKTWCYIPTLCTAIINCLENELIPNTNGPLAIVLVASSDRAITVSDYCTHLLRKLERPDAKTLCSFGVRELIQTKILLMEGCGILVATPPNFRRLLEDNKGKDPLFNSQRLRHIIIDDIDVMFSRCKDDLTMVIKSLYSLTPKMAASKKLSTQLVVTSRAYLPVLEKLILISKQPLLVIGDFLEAAVYGKAKICFEIWSNTQKIQRIIDFIEEHSYKKESLIILCNRDDDVFDICERLKLAGIDCLGCHSESKALVRQQVLEWKLPANIHSMVLVCTDSVLYEFEIQNVQNMIHYSLAWLWAKMKFRFSVHKETYENVVKTNFSHNKSGKKHATSLILLDEENNEELPRIVDFLKSHNQLKFINPDVVKISKHISIKREKERCKADNQFCDQFFEYGECDKLACQKRHMLTENDLNASEDKTPLIQSGDLRMLVVNVYSPTHYDVRLLEHRTHSAASWRCIQQSDKAASFAMRLNLFYSNTDNINKHWPIRFNDICVIERNGTFRRVRVLKVPPIKSENMIKTLDVTIKLIDDGDTLTEKSDSLYVCHEKFKDFPAQSHKIRLIGLRPLDNETSWDADTTFYVKGILMNKLQKNESVCASVCFSLTDAIVVRNVFVMKKLLTLGNFIVKTNLKRDLANKNYAVIDENAEKRMQDIIEGFRFECVLSEPPTDTTEDETETTVEVEQAAEEEFYGNKKEEVKTRNDIEIKKSTKIIMENKSTKNENNEYDIKEKIIKPTVTSRSDFIKNLRKTTQEKSLACINTVPNDTQETPLPAVCSYLEFLQVLQRSNELDAEDYDLEGDDMEQVRDYIYQTDRLCKLEIMRELERQNKNTITNAIENAVSAQSKTLENSLEVSCKEMNLVPYTNVTAQAAPMPMLLESSKKKETCAGMNSPPPLHNLHKRPQTCWYETNHLIILSISAPDIDDYYLEVEKTFLFFMAMVNGVQEVLILNFLGTIEPQYTSHEKVGLKVIVRLVKRIFMRWPRLLKQTEKMPWLSYNLNMLNIEEMAKILPQQFIERVLHKQFDHALYDNDDYDSDESDVDLQTYTPIINSDDMHDPINAELF